MLELLMFLLILFKGLKAKEVTKKTFIALPVITFFGLYNDHNVFKIHSFENVLELIVLSSIAVIAGAILGSMKIIEFNKGKYYIKSSYKYIGSWLVILLLRLLVSKVFFQSQVADADWITWVYYLLFYATRSIVIILKYPEVAVAFFKQ